MSNTKKQLCKLLLVSLEVPSLLGSRADPAVQCSAIIMHVNVQWSMQLTGVPGGPM